MNNYELIRFIVHQDNVKKMFLKEYKINCMRTALLNRINSMMFSIFCQISQAHQGTLRKCALTIFVRRWGKIFMWV